MEQKPSEKEPKKSSVGYLWPFALGIGTAVGIGIGAAIDSIGAGLVIGVGVGIVAGLVFSRRFKSNPRDD